MRTRSIRAQRFPGIVLAVGVAVAGMTLTGQAAAGCGAYGPIILPAPADDAGQLPEATGFLKTL